MLEWLVKIILQVILGRLEKAALGHAKKIEDDKKKGVTNAENVKVYKEAIDRAEKIKAATDLLNGTSSK